MSELKRHTTDEPNIILIEGNLGTWLREIAEKPIAKKGLEVWVTEDKGDNELLKQLETDFSSKYADGLILAKTEHNSLVMYQYKDGSVYVCASNDPEEISAYASNHIKFDELFLLRETKVHKEAPKSGEIVLSGLFKDVYSKLVKSDYAVVELPLPEVTPDKLRALCDAQGYKHSTEPLTGVIAIHNSVNRQTAFAINLEGTGVILCAGITPHTLKNHVKALIPQALINTGGSGEINVTTEPTSFEEIKKRLLDADNNGVNDRVNLITTREKMDVVRAFIIEHTSASISDGGLVFTLKNSVVVQVHDVNRPQDIDRNLKNIGKLNEVKLMSIVCEGG